MAKWDVEVVHAFTGSLEDAKAGTRRLLDEFQKQYGSVVKKIVWSEDGASATLEGNGFDGAFTVADGKVTAGIKLGLMLRMMKGRVESEMRKRLVQLVK